MSAAGEKILGSIREARAILRGESAGELVVHVPREFDLKALRRKLGMSQSRFAKNVGFGLAAVQGWEQGRRPEGTAHPTQGDRGRAGSGEAHFGRMPAESPQPSLA